MNEDPDSFIMHNCFLPKTDSMASIFSSSDSERALDRIDSLEKLEEHLAQTSKGIVKKRSDEVLKIKPSPLKSS